MKVLGLIGVSVIALTAWTPVLAQAAPSAPSGDIIVTATKRDQSLQSVPISVSVTSSDTLQKAKITDIIDLQSVVPSLKITQYQNPGQTDFIIRGFGNGHGNIGIESSVGVFVDGVYMSRSASALADLPDVERVEVLRGPQSTLFGKNVSAGAISITTQAPKFKWGGSAEATLGNYGDIGAKAMINAPISDVLALKVYGSVDQRDGYDNNVSGGTVNNRNRWLLRADLLYKPSSDFSLRITGMYNKIHENCCAAVPVYNHPVFAGALSAASGIPITGGLQNPFSNITNYNYLPDDRLTGKQLSAQIDWNVGIGKLTSITAWHDQTNAVVQDVDFTPVDLANQNSNDEYQSFSQEIRLASKGNGPLSWLIGGFYSNEIDTTNRNITIGADARNYANILIQALSGGTASLPLIETVFAGYPHVAPGVLFSQGQGVSDNWHMNDTSFSIFGQVDYKILPKLTLTAGAAYLKDHKKVESNVNTNDVFSSLPFYGPYAAFAGLQQLQLFPIYPKNYIFGYQPGNFPNGQIGTSTNALDNPVLNGDKVTYNARIAYEVTPHINVYASYGTGWKAGAYDLSYYSTPGNRSALPENVTVYEAGLKAHFKGGYINIAGFIQSIKNFQQNPFLGTGYVLLNANKESTRGFEFDAVYAPVKSLVLGLNGTYLDPKYNSFTNATCSDYPGVMTCAVAPSTATQVCSPTNPPPNCIQVIHDISGTRPAEVPTWSITASALYTQQLGGGYSAYIRGEYDYQSSFQLTEVVPSQFGTTSISTVNGSIGFATPFGLTAQLWVRNLTNDRYLLEAFPAVFQGAKLPSGTSISSYSGYPNQPRTWGVTLKKVF